MMLKTRKTWLKILMIIPLAFTAIIGNLVWLLFSIILVPVGIVLMPMRIAYVATCYQPKEFNNARYK